MVIISILISLVIGGASLASSKAKESKCRAQISGLEILFDDTAEVVGVDATKNNDGQKKYTFTITIILNHL